MCRLLMMMMMMMPRSSARPGTAERAEAESTRATSTLRPSSRRPLSSCNQPRNLKKDKSDKSHVGGLACRVSVSPRAGLLTRHSVYLTYITCTVSAYCNAVLGTLGGLGVYMSYLPSLLGWPFSLA